MKHEHRAGGGGTHEMKLFAIFDRTQSVNDNSNELNCGDRMNMSNVRRPLSFGEKAVIFAFEIFSRLVRVCYVRFI